MSEVEWVLRLEIDFPDAICKLIHTQPRMELRFCPVLTTVIPLYSSPIIISSTSQYPHITVTPPLTTTPLGYHILTAHFPVIQTNFPLPPPRLHLPPPTP